MQLAAGDRLAQYEILGPLGAGGMGEVYRARDAKLGRDIALKILPAELGSNVEALRRFEQEARAASALNHPNIVTIYDVGKDGDRTWIAMELIDGLDLRTLAVREPLTVKSALRIAVKVIEGLVAAHERDIVHRDLKPDNIMVTPDGFVKLLDFGLAKHVRTISSEDTTIPHTTPGAVFGTVGYMSPEQANGKEMDYRSDQFSFGVVLYEMLTGVRPFDRATKMETMAAILRDEVPPPSTLNPQIPFELDRLITRCLARNPRDRYGSTRDLARDLRDIRDGLTTTSPKVRSVPPSKARVRRFVLPVTAALLLLLVVAGGVVMWQQRSRAAAKTITAVAVLPFRDLTSTPDGRVLADGISELIAVRLAEIHDLRVSAPFAGARVAEGDDVGAIASRRGVQAVIRGTVQRGGDEVRVTYSLVAAKANQTLVSRNVTRSASELFALEDDIADDLISALGRTPVARPQAAAVLLGADDQRQFTEAMGLLQRVRDERSVDRAIASLESILRNARESGPVNALLARALLYKAALAQRPALVEQAAIFARRGVLRSPADPESHITLGKVLHASGEGAEAEAAFHRALKLRPGDAEATTGLADVLAAQGRGADAEAMYRKAIALRPDGASTFLKYGVFCYNDNRAEEAVGHFRKAIELMPDSARAWANLGGALQALGRDGEAMAAYRHSIDIEQTAPGWSNLGTLQFMLGLYDEALRSYRRAAELAPADPVSWANLGDACLAAKDAACASEVWPRAIANAREALQVNPEDAPTRAILAAALAKSGDDRDAQAEIRRALESNPTHAIVLYQAAVVATLRGNLDGAMSWLEEAIRAGYPAADAQRDPILAPLRNLPAFATAVKSPA